MTTNEKLIEKRTKVKELSGKWFHTREVLDLMNAAREDEKKKEASK